MSRATEIIKYEGSKSVYIIKGTYLRHSGDLKVSYLGKLLEVGKDYEETSPESITLLKPLKEGYNLTLEYSAEAPKSTTKMSSSMLEYMMYNTGKVNNKVISSIIDSVLDKIKDIIDDFIGTDSSGSGGFSKAPIEHLKVPYRKKFEVEFGEPCTKPPTITFGYQFTEDSSINLDIELPTPTCKLIMKDEGTSVNYVGCEVNLPNSAPDYIEGCYITMIAICPNYPSKLEV